MLPPFHIVITSLNVGRLVEATSQIKDLLRWSFASRLPFPSLLKGRAFYTTHFL
jgi:hypothetical protein